MKIRNRTKVSIALVILFFFTWMFLLRPTSLGGPTSYIMIFGNSMKPALNHNDFVLMLKRDTYRVSDIVTFKVQDKLVIHRIVGGTAVEGFTVQGDNKQYPDSWHPKEEQIIGSIWLRLPGFGKYLLQLRQPFVFAGLAGILYCILITPWLVDMLKSGQRKHKKKNAIMQRRRERALAKHMPLHIARKLNRLSEF